MDNAARKGDMTAHGGVIVGGLDTVLIEGRPAARCGDMHVCPMCNPGTPPPPHVGGPIATGSATVLIGGLPAARVGDIATCVGPPDLIAMGSATVIIGDAAASESNVSSGTAKQASASAHQALRGGRDGREQGGSHWIEFEVVDEVGGPISGMGYQYTDVDGTVSQHKLTDDGQVNRGGLAREGSCELSFQNVMDVKWSVDIAQIGDSVELSAKCHGFAEGSPALFEIWQRNRHGREIQIGELETVVVADNISSHWRLENSDSIIGCDTSMQDSLSGHHYFFRVKVAGCESSSGLLRYHDWLEIILVNAESDIGKNYLLILADSSVRKGTINNSGVIREENVPAGGYELIIENRHEIHPS